jgi:hypothetical protein
LDILFYKRQKGPHPKGRGTAVPPFLTAKTVRFTHEHPHALSLVTTGCSPKPTPRRVRFGSSEAHSPLRPHRFAPATGSLGV